MDTTTECNQFSFLLADRECVPFRVTRLPEKLEKIRCSTMSSDSEEDCITLEPLSEDGLHSIALNPKYRQLILELLGNERQPEDIWPDNSLENEMRISEGSVADPTISDEHSEGLVADPASSLPRDTALDRASPSSLGKRSSLVDEKQPPAKKQKMNPEASCSTTEVFDPILAGSEEDKYHFKPHKVVKDYLETHFRLKAEFYICTYSHACSENISLPNTCTLYL